MPPKSKALQLLQLLPPITLINWWSQKKIQDGLRLLIFPKLYNVLKPWTNYTLRGLNLWEKRRDYKTPLMPEEQSADRTHAILRAVVRNRCVVQSPHAKRWLGLSQGSYKILWKCWQTVGVKGNSNVSRSRDRHLWRLWNHQFHMAPCLHEEIIQSFNHRPPPKGKAKKE